MASSKCFVLPSNFEPFGVVITEAAATGCSIIASDAVGAADHMVIEGVNGFIFPVNDSRGLAQALLEMTKFSDQQFIDGEVASKKLAKGFSPDTWTKKVLGAYQLSKSK
jgi:glycosyltransferase involved in cell wall biosynthesis